MAEAATLQRTAAISAKALGVTRFPQSDPRSEVGVHRRHAVALSMLTGEVLALLSDDRCPAPIFPYSI